MAVGASLANGLLPASGDPVFIQYADGREVSGAPVAESDVELVADGSVLEELSRVGWTERRTPGPTEHVEATI